MRYAYRAWIHPPKGDDYMISGNVSGLTRKIAKKRLEAELSKKSAITTDYDIWEA